MEPTEQYHSLIESMIHVHELKKKIRAGWEKRGLENAEHVADHGYGVIMWTIHLTRLQNFSDVDTLRAMKMAAIHDLPEAIMPDYTPDEKVLEEVKTREEITALGKICAGLSIEDEILELMVEYKENKTPIAQLVHAGDKIDMMLTSHLYSREQPNERLEEFWTKISEFNWGVHQSLFDSLKEIHIGQ